MGNHSGRKRNISRRLIAALIALVITIAQIEPAFAAILPDNMPAPARILSFEEKNPAFELGAANGTPKESLELPKTVRAEVPLEDTGLTAPRSADELLKAGEFTIKENETGADGAEGTGAESAGTEGAGAEGAGAEGAGTEGTGETAGIPVDELSADNDALEIRYDFMPYGTGEDELKKITELGWGQLENLRPDWSGAEIHVYGYITNRKEIEEAQKLFEEVQKRYAEINEPVPEDQTVEIPAPVFKRFIYGSLRGSAPSWYVLDGTGKIKAILPDIPVTWECAEYDAEKEGVYTFTAASDQYRALEGVVWPAGTVNVAAKEESDITDGDDRQDGAAGSNENGPEGYTATDEKSKEEKEESKEPEQGTKEVKEETKEPEQESKEVKEETKEPEQESEEVKEETKEPEEESKEVKEETKEPEQESKEVKEETKDA